jgi:hypothetical protein
MSDETKTDPAAPASPPAVIVPDAPPTIVIDAPLAPISTLSPAAPGPTPADYDAAVAQVALLDGHLHELEVALNERDAEILSLRAKLEATPASTPGTGEITCTTCGTRLPRI